MSTGMLGFIGVGVDSVGGASATTGAYSSTVFNWVPFVSETLTNQRNDIVSQAIQSQFDSTRRYTGLQTVQGNVVAEIHPVTAGFLLRTWFDSCTAVTSDGANPVGSNAGVRGHIFKATQTQFHAGSGSDVPTVTFEAFRGPTTSAGTSFVYYNCAGDTFEISIQAGQLATFTLGVLARDYGRKAQSSPTFPPPEAFTWSQASVTIGGAARPIFESVTIRGNNQLQAKPLLDGRLRANLIKRNGFRTVEMNGTMSFQTDSDYDMWIAGSQYPVQIYFAGAYISSSLHQAALMIDIPAFQYSQLPINVGGPGTISIPFQGTCEWHSGSGTALEITLVNTRINAYSVNSNG